MLAAAEKLQRRSRLVWFFKTLTLFSMSRCWLLVSSSLPPHQFLHFFYCSQRRTGSNSHRSPPSKSFRPWREKANLHVPGEVDLTLKNDDKDIRSTCNRGSPLRVARRCCQILILMLQRCFEQKKRTCADDGTTQGLDCCTRSHRSVDSFILSAEEDDHSVSAIELAVAEVANALHRRRR